MRYSHRILLCFASYVFLFFFFNLFISTIFFFLNKALPSWLGVLSFFCAGISLIVVFSGELLALRRVVIFFVGGMFALTVFSSCWFAGQFLDSSFDGRDYHMDSIIALSNGWNPTTFRMPHVDAPLYGRYTRMYYFPKGVETTHASLFLLYRHIEYPKGIIFVLALSVFFLSYCMFSVVFKFSFRISFTLGVLLVLNPVFIFQSLNYYIDAYTYFMFSGVIVVSLLYTYFRDTFFVLLLFIYFALIPSLKVTSFVIGGIWCLWIFLYLLYSRFVKDALVFICAVFCAYSICFFFLCWNPFVTTVLTHKPLFYPVSSDLLKLAHENMPEDMFHKSRVERLVLSLFAVGSTNRDVGTVTFYKIPFMLEPGEMIPFVNPDIITGGFGPFVSGVLVLIMVFFVYLIVRNSYDRRLRLLLYCFFIILLTCLSTPIPNNARFTPQVWLLFVFGVACMMAVRGSPVFLGWVSIFFLYLNIWYISESYIRYARVYTERNLQDLAYLATYSRKNPLYLELIYFYSVRVRLREAGVVFIPVPQGWTCPGQERIFKTNFPEMKLYSCVHPS